MKVLQVKKVKKVMKAKKVKQILAFVISGSMVFQTVPILPPHVYAAEVREAVLEKIPHAQMAAKANTEMVPVSGNDGGAVWAIDDNADGTANTTTLWHARYGGTPAAGEVPKNSMPQTITLDLNNSIEEGSIQSYMVKQVDVVNRGTNRIGNYELQIANAVTPTDEDFVTVARGTFPDVRLNSIVLPIAVEATHVRLVGKNSIGGADNLVVVANIEVQQDTAASKEDNAEVLGITYQSGKENYLIDGFSQDTDTYEVWVPYGVTIADLASKCIMRTVGTNVTTTVDSEEKSKTFTHKVGEGASAKTYTVTYKESIKEIPQTQFSAKANTEQLPAGYINDGGAEWAINGNLNNWWHARYQNPESARPDEIPIDTFPHELTINLDKDQEGALHLVNIVKITSRSDGSDTLKNCKLLVSKDGTDFTEVLVKTDLASSKVNTFIFAEPVLAKYIRLQVTALNKVDNSRAQYTTVADFRAYEEANSVTAAAAIIGDMAQGTVAVDKPICKPNTTVTFTTTANQGYRFVGWYNNPNGDGEAVSTEQTYTTTISENTMLYAKYEAATEGNLTAGVVTGTTQGTASVNKAVIAIGENAIFTAEVTDKDYEFAGWYQNQDGSGDVVSTDNPYTVVVSGDLTLYAKFQKKPLVAATEALREVYDACTPYLAMEDAYTDASYSAFKSAYDTATGLLGTPTTAEDMNAAKSTLETTKGQLLFYKEFVVNGTAMDISQYALGIKTLKNYTISFVFQLDESVTGTDTDITLLSLQNAEKAEKMNFYVNPKKDTTTSGRTGILNYRTANATDFYFTHLAGSALVDVKWHTVTFQSQGDQFKAKLDGNLNTFKADGDISQKAWVQDVTKVVIGDGIGNNDFKGNIQRVIISGANDDTIDIKPATTEERTTYTSTLAYLESVPTESRSDALVAAIATAQAAVNDTSILAAVNNATMDMKVEKANIFETIFKYGAGDNDQFVVRASNSKPAAVPEKPTKSGYTFKGWFTAEYGDANVGVTEVTDYTKAQTVCAQWDKNYTVTVAGGTIVDKVADPTTGEYVSNTKVVLRADAPEEGKKFAGWYANDELVGTDAIYTYYVTKAMNFEAKFVTTDTPAVQIENGVRLDDVLLMNSYMDITKANIRFYGQVNMVPGKTPIEAGIVWTTDATAGQNLKIGVPNVKKAAANKISSIGQFSITITGAPSDVTMYARMYVKYADGTDYYYSIKQGNIVSGTANIVPASTGQVE